LRRLVRTAAAEGFQRFESGFLKADTIFCFPQAPRPAYEKGFAEPREIEPLTSPVLVWRFS